jgi:tryptophan 2,3-dioxygenase
VDPFAFDPYRLDFPDHARRFETGTPTVPALYAANAGLALVGGLDPDAVRRHVQDLTELAAASLALQGERLDTPAPPDRGAHVALLDSDPPALAGWLRERRIAVSPRGDVVRLSFHYYNCAADVDAVCEEIARYRRAGAAPAAGATGPPWQRELSAWRSRGDADAFPYEAVIDEYHRVGKHFVAAELLDALEAVRHALPEASGSAAARSVLERFLGAALDKRDGRYDYPTYLALDLLPLPGAGDDDGAVAEGRRDALLAGLVADALRFELDADGGRTGLLPRMRPDARTVGKRCRLGLQVLEPCLRRLGLPGTPESADPVAAAGHVCRQVEGATAADLRTALRLTMLPVHVVHDEWMFIRVLQSFETAFALVAVRLRAAVAGLGDGRCGQAARDVEAGEGALHEASPLFSLLATMQVEAFRTFREHTEGASAIQSRGYKLVESLCRTPDEPRLDSIAYRSVPEVRERVLEGQPTLDEALLAARASGRADAGELEEVELAMRRFAGRLLQWRRTHHRLAVRMLGERTGTGYTEGTPYLGAVRTIPVFRSTGEGGGGDA